MSKELKKLNHYPEWKTIEGINSVINFVRNGNLPVGLNHRQAVRFIEKFGPNSGFVVRLVGHQPILFYHPNDDLNIEVIKPDDRTDRLQEIYNDFTRGLGVGLSSFYHQVSQNYLNINKTLTDDFLRKQGDYLISIVPRHTINKPIITKSPNQRWGVDLIDMRAYHIPNVNGQRKYILTVIDYFTGKVFARAILNRDNSDARPTLANAINDICDNDAQCYPHQIQGDTEFNSGSFKTWCRDHHIKFIKTMSYSPTSNGKVERANREIRKKTKAGFIRNNNLAWVQYLPDYIENINNQQNVRTGFSPNELWTPGYNPNNHPLQPINEHLNDIHMNEDQRLNQQRAIINDKTKKAVSKGRTPNFEVNDLVRIKLLVINNTMRKAKKQKQEWNKIAIHYTPQIYTVIRAYHHQPNFIRRDEYVLSDLNGNVLMDGATQKRFFGSELIKVPINSVETNINPGTVQRAIQLNRLEF